MPDVAGEVPARRAEELFAADAVNEFCVHSAIVAAGPPTIVTD